MLTSPFLVLLFTSLVYSAPTVQDDKIHIPEKCEDVLAVKVCQNISQVAKNLKLKSSEVTETIKEVVKNGTKAAEDIYKKVLETLQEKVISKKCDDFLSAEKCASLRNLAGKLKIKAEKVEEFVIKALIQGKDTASSLVDQVIEYYKNEIKTKSCEDFLTQSQCDQIKDVSNTLKLKTNQWKDAFVDGLVKAKKDGTEILTETFNNIKEFAKNTKCEDLLNPNVCATLRKYAEATKVGFPKVMDAAINAIIKGYKLGKGLIKAIYDITDYFYDCEDVFDKSSCDRLKNMVSYIGIKATQIDEIVRKYVRKGIDLGSSLYDKVMKYLKEKVLCKINIFCKDDDKDDDVVKRSADESELVRKIKDAISKTLPKLNESFKDLIAKAAAKSKKIKDELKVILEKIAVNGKAKYEALKKLIKDIISNDKSDELASHHEVVKRDIYDDLKAALAHASDRMRKLLNQFLTLSKEHLNSMRTTVYNIINKIMGPEEAKQHLDAVDQMIDDAIYNDMEDIMKAAEDEVTRSLKDD